MKIICIRCQGKKKITEMQPQRRHCHLCQRRADRISYYHHRFERLEKVNRRRAEAYGCQIADGVDYALIYAAGVGEPCGLCAQPVTPDNYEFDHTIALADGGPHSEQNIRLVHRYCNRAESMRIFILLRVFNRTT